ncbi:MAG TPA: 2-phospho-L-lactate guanylyltransferase [Nocardioides sp.]|uniref:2-phospho-L-lactate guanylyltransferase n=1 Tax=Nocardioides sp. TaxID=35761 RepID=UPI002D802B69|nr:2-phospho-L-lactate guanylyltransferase [Nocardioides sp.]HET6653800.1 2-phospho-L-lactate guanylyltransferase [Nocardioides sp.]
MPSANARFGVIVPAKPPAFAKSRLGRLGDEVRRSLAAAFAADTVEAAMRAELVDVVLVVTDDHRLAASLRTLGADVIPDGTTDDLNASLMQAAAELVRRSPGVRPTALCADLPSLRPAELDRALSAAGDGAAFVADADEVGTTLLTAVDLADFRPAFGSGSRAAHRGLGASEIDVDGIDSVRRDVDTTDDLAAALGMGIGPHTSRVTADLF